MSNLLLIPLSVFFVFHFSFHLLKLELGLLKIYSKPLFNLLNI